MTRAAPPPLSATRGEAARAGAAHPAPAGSALGRLRPLWPGLLLCAGVSVAAYALAALEAALFGRAWIEPLVLAILLGVGLRTAWTPGGAWQPGIHFAGKTLLEVAVVLLGTALSAHTLWAVGPVLVAGILVVVALAVAGGYALGRQVGLPKRMAMLVACGNAICGNSAIAAVAPVIGAQARDVASAIAFTAVLGVVVVLALPILVPLLGLTEAQFGVVAGLTVYAVPQVLAATAPVGATAVQVGTLVKLVRVLMLGPVVVALSLLAPRFREAGEAVPGAVRLRLTRVVPWFILGFLAAAALRSLGLVPPAALGPIATVATGLTVLSMAALGLGVDVRSVLRAGPKVVLTVVGSLLVLGVVSLGLVALHGPAP
ncbi:putative sulfate exporter family transporter [Roseomonas sp. OT10]|uniref:YeiH family protein n=1 Tax=Roseomonas cutis TaxID=2897332 RepID=UPI001E423709|nr:putative sulfate exporter family transporter [Roseomonas sp. OT10]UFN47859.1 putative sulfate exporter family transporter [Roseomonas sp. OT10]